MIAVSDLVGDIAPLEQEPSSSSPHSSSRISDAAQSEAVEAGRPPTSTRNRSSDERRPQLVEVDSVCAEAPALRQPCRKPTTRLSAALPRRHAMIRKRPLNCKFSVELRGFEPLAPSMRTRCATRLRYSPEKPESA